MVKTTKQSFIIKWLYVVIDIDKIMLSLCICYYLCLLSVYFIFSWSKSTDSCIILDSTSSFSGSFNFSVEVVVSDIGMDSEALVSSLFTGSALSALVSPLITGSALSALVSALLTGSAFSDLV